jgi:hypothetical protein
VVHLVFLTFFGTGVAHVRTKLTEILHEVGTPAHERRRLPAQGGTILVQPNAFRHPFDIFLMKAGFCAMFAFFCAAHAGVDTGLILVMRHGNAPFVKAFGDAMTNSPILAKNKTLCKLRAHRLRDDSPYRLSARTPYFLFLSCLAHQLP